MSAFKAIRYLMSPSSIAVVGASRTPGKIGHEILKNIIEYGFKGQVYPVNPRATEVLGLKCYPSVSSIGKPVDLAIIVIPAQAVLPVIRDCVKSKVKVAAVITSGFGEVGNKQLEAEVVKTAREGGMRILGPNIFGVYCAASDLNATFGPKDVLKGSIAFITQSGALGIALMGWTITEKIGLSAIVSIGNKADLDDADFIEYFNWDNSTRVILIYIEGVRDGRRFMEAALETSINKPIIALKSGVSKRGMVAASSHTGSLAGSAQVYKAAFKQSGVLIASTVSQAFDWARMFSSNFKFYGYNTVIITNGGGVGVMASDACEKLSIPLIDPSEELKNKLRRFMPPFGSVKNPIDLTGMASEEDYKGAISTCLSSEEVNAIIVLYCETAVTNPVMIAKTIASSIKAQDKPVVASLIGGSKTQLAINELNYRGVPAYNEPYKAVDSLSAFFKWNKWRTKSY